MYVSQVAFTAATPSAAPTSTANDEMTPYGLEATAGHPFPSQFEHTRAPQGETFKCCTGASTHHPRMAVAEAPDNALMQRLVMELTNLTKLVLHSNDQLEALRSQCEASFQNVNARLELMDGRVKMLEGAKSCEKAAVSRDQETHPFVGLHADEYPTAKPLQSVNIATSPHTESSRLPQDSGMSTIENAKCAGRTSSTPQMVVTTCKSAYSQYLSTQAFIADISRKFNETQDLLNKASLKPSLEQSS